MRAVRASSASYSKVSINLYSKMNAPRKQTVFGGRYVKSLNGPQIYVLGGVGAVSDAIVQSLYK